MTERRVFIVFEREARPGDVIVCATREGAEAEVERVRSEDTSNGVSDFRRRIMRIREIQVRE